MELNDIFVGMIPPEDISEYPSKTTTTFEEDENDETNQKVNWEE